MPLLNYYLFTIHSFTIHYLVGFPPEYHFISFLAAAYAGIGYMLLLYGYAA